MKFLVLIALIVAAAVEAQAVPKLINRPLGVGQQFSKGEFEFEYGKLGSKFGSAIDTVVDLIGNAAVSAATIAGNTASNFIRPVVLGLLKPDFKFPTLPAAKPAVGLFGIQPAAQPPTKPAFSLFGN